MVNYVERQKLLRAMGNKSDGAAATLINCAAGLLILIGCALFGSAPNDARVERAETQLRKSAAIAESKAVFDARRVRFETSDIRRSEIAQR